jgi:transcriptional regulator with XRE-family HTH domain
MNSFGKRLRACREAKDLSQQEVAARLATSYTVIGKYERGEMTPSVEVAKKLSVILDTTVGYLLGETEEVNILKDPAMLKRLNEINSLPEDEKKSILLTVDAFLRDFKTRKAYAS